MLTIFITFYKNLISIRFDFFPQFQMVNQVNHLFFLLLIFLVIHIFV